MSEQLNPNGCVVVFHGGKPGEGKSFIAQNLAAVLVLNEHKRVLLYDLDLEARAEHTIRWNLAVNPTVSDLAGHLAQFDENTIRGYFPKSVSGVELATLARNEQEALGVSNQQIIRSLQLFRQAYDFVIVDGLRGWDPLVLSVLDVSDLILMVCAPDLVGLKQESMDCLKYRELKFPAAKIHLVLNRASLTNALNSQDLEKALPGHRVLTALPFDAQATEAQNQHAELVSLYPNSGFTKAIKRLAKTIAGTRSQTVCSEMEASGLPSPMPVYHIDRVKIKERIQGLLLDHAELKNIASELNRTPQSQTRLREKVETVVTSLMALEAPELTKREERERLVLEVVDEALGLGPLEELIRDPRVTEIMVNRPDQIYIETSGRLEKSAKHFLNEKQLMTVIERIVAPLGRRIDESQPYVDARLPDGSRVHAIIPPLALQGPTLTIRKFSKQRFQIDDLVRFGSLTQELANFLSLCVKGRKNLVISGGTGSGKTTLLNILASHIPETERIITVEDAAELDLPQAHVVTLESRPANIEGKGAIAIRDLVRNCLRMRPDRIVVGECRGGEALDMLQAMNTGHDGSLTTVHANSPKDAVSRLETMMLMSGMDLPIRAIRDQIASAVHLIVQQSRMQDGTRKVTQVSEVDGIEEGAVVVKDLFIFKQTGLDRSGNVQGVFKATGEKPSFLESLQARGLELDPKIFKK